MSLLEILEVPHPGLRAVAKPVDTVDEGVRDTINDTSACHLADRNHPAGRTASNTR